MTMHDSHDWDDERMDGGGPETYASGRHVCRVCSAHYDDPEATAPCPGAEKRWAVETEDQATWAMHRLLAAEDVFAVTIPGGYLLSVRLCWRLA